MNEINDNNKTDLINRAKELIEKGKGVFYRGSISILKTGVKKATEKNNFSDLIEYVPKYEIKYKRMKREIDEYLAHQHQRKIWEINHLFNSYTKEMLHKELAKCEKKSSNLKKEWDVLRRDERTQRKATISNSLDSNAKKMMLVQDALLYMEKNNLQKIE